MSAETLFYIAGAVLVLTAVGFFLVARQNYESFPSPAVLRLGAVVFATIVGATTTFALINARDEQEHRQQELAAEKQQAATPGGVTVKFSVAPGTELAFEQKNVNAKAGEDIIELANQSEVGHDVTIEQGGKELGKTEIVSKSTSSAKLDLKPGKYTFFCSVPGHREAGMEGTLTVK